MLSRRMVVLLCPLPPKQPSSQTESHPVTFWSWMDNVGHSGKFHPHQLFSLEVVHCRGYPPLRARQGGQSGPLAAVDCPTGQGPSRQEETDAEVRDDWVRRDAITALELWAARLSSLASPPSLQVPLPLPSLSSLWFLYWD